jgi:hypothetical protein
MVSFSRASKIDTIKKNRESFVVAGKEIGLKVHRFEAWSLTTREEHRLRVLENRVLRMIFGPKKGEVTGLEKTA